MIEALYVDGPMAGKLVQLPDFQPVRLLFTNGDDLPLFRNTGPTRESSVFREVVYRVHTIGRTEATGAPATVFPAWRFTTWSMEDESWARPAGLCSAGQVITRKLLHLLAIDPKTVDRWAISRAQEMLKPDIEFCVDTPRGYVLPVDFAMPAETNHYR